MSRRTIWQKVRHGHEPLEDALMNRYSQLLAKCLLLLPAAGALTACAQRPTAAITEVQMQDVKLTHAMLLFSVKVENPYVTPLPISSLNYTLASGNQVFLEGKT